MTEIPNRLSIPWLQETYRSGALTPVETAEEIVRRAEAAESYHIWIVPPAMERMRPYLEALPKDPAALPLWGIPFAVKDNIDVAGVPTTAACPDYSYTPERDADVVKRLIAAGAFPVGKTNLDQFATGLVGTRSPYGEVHNSLDPDLISGGSSSGSAVAVARGMAAFSLGTDTAGSGRVPAALNNLVGLKTAPGAWSTRGVVPACASLDCVSVFAGSIAETQRVDAAVRGYDPECAWSREIPTPLPLVPKKILFAKPEDLTFYGPYADVYEKKWQSAKARMTQLGIYWEEIDYSMFQTAAAILYDGPWIAERWADLGGFVESHPGSTFPVTEKILRSGSAPELSAADLFRTQHRLAAYRQQARQILRDAVLVMPTAGGTFSRDEVRRDPVRTNSQMGLYTNHCNLLDLAAIAVPENTQDTSLPFGITLFSRSDSEGLLFGLADRFLQSEA